DPARALDVDPRAVAREPLAPVVVMRIEPVLVRLLLLRRREVLAEVPGNVAVFEHEPVRAARPDPDLEAAHARSAQGHVLARHVDPDSSERVRELALARPAQLAGELDRDAVAHDLDRSLAAPVAEHGLRDLEAARAFDAGITGAHAHLLERLAGAQTGSEEKRSRDRRPLPKEGPGAQTFRASATTRGTSSNRKGQCREEVLQLGPHPRSLRGRLLPDRADRTAQPDPGLEDHAAGEARRALRGRRGPDDLEQLEPRRLRDLRAFLARPQDVVRDRQARSHL